MSNLQKQLEERVMSNIRAVTNIPPNTVTSLSEEYIRTAVANIVRMCESYAATREAEGLRDFAKKVSPIRDEVGWHITPKQVQLIEETAKGKDSNG